MVKHYEVYYKDFQNNTHFAPNVTAGMLDILRDRYIIISVTEIKGLI